MQGDRQGTGHLGAPQSRELAMMDTGTQSQVPSHRVERILKSCAGRSPPLLGPGSPTVLLSARALQLAANTRLQRGYQGSLSESYWRSGRRQAEAVGDVVHTGRRGGQASSLGFSATPLPRGPAACVGSHAANTDAEPRAVPPRSGASSGRSPGAARRRLSLSTHSILAW